MAAQLVCSVAAAVVSGALRLWVVTPGHVETLLLRVSACTAVAPCAERLQCKACALADAGLPLL